MDIRYAVVRLMEDGTSSLPATGKRAYPFHQDAYSIQLVPGGDACILPESQSMARILECVPSYGPLACTVVYIAGILYLVLLNVIEWAFLNQSMSLTHDEAKLTP